jgi:hypothetical protein
MMAISLIALLIVGALFVGLISAIAAIATKRPMVAVAIGGAILVMFGLSVASLFVWRVSGVAGPPTAQLVPPNGFGQPSITFNDGGSYVTHTTWRVSFEKVAFLAGGAIAQAVFAARRACGNRPAGRRGNWWPALLVIPVLLALPMLSLLWTGLSYQHHVRTISPGPSTQISQLDIRYPSMDGYQAPTIEAQAKQMRVAQEQAMRVQQAAANNSAALAAIQQQISHMNIDALMDLFEKPKIDLHATMPATPAIPSAPNQASPPAVPPTPVSTVAELRVNNVSQETAEAEVETAEAAGIAATAAGEAKQATVPAEAVAQEASTDRKSPKKGDTKTNAAKKIVTVAPPADDHFGQPAKSLPKWANEPPHRYMPDSWRETIATDEYATAEECRQATDVYLLYKAYDRLQTLLDRPNLDTELPSLTFYRGKIIADGTVIYDKELPWYWNDSRIALLNKMGIGIDYLRGNVIVDQHLADTERSSGPMVKQYTLLEYTKATDTYLRQHWQATERQERFMVVGAGAGGVFGILGLVFGLLKIDTWTKGYYSKWLFIGVPAAIICAGFLLMPLLYFA